MLTEEAVCLLDVPVHKTDAALSKPVDPLVGQAIDAWQALRPAQPAQPNGTVSLQSDDIDANSDTEPRRSDIRHLAILQPWHPPGAAECGEIEY